MVLCIWLLPRTFTAFLPLKPHGMDTSSQINPQRCSGTPSSPGALTPSTFFLVSELIDLWAIVHRRKSKADSSDKCDSPALAKVELLGIMSYSMSPSGPIVAPIQMILYPHSTTAGPGWYHNFDPFTLRSWTSRSAPRILPQQTVIPASSSIQTPTSFLVAANAITLRTDLKVYFYNHNFTVDADDNYSVIVPREMGNVQKLLPVHLLRRLDGDAGDVPFFRLHPPRVPNLYAPRERHLRKVSPTPNSGQDGRTGSVQPW
ncbi:hypothetical protein B0H14DRAFT_2566108 [Mycena olivaceomarginata]|nr:hypothetical protein B0H14DRAFT_2566108 [Mycena olivaceomarginata]